MITITGLTQKQRALMDVMWQFESLEQVNSFIKTLPKRDQLDCQSLITIAVQETEEHEHQGLEQYESLAASVISRARSS